MGLFSKRPAVPDEPETRWQRRKAYIAANIAALSPRVVDDNRIRILDSGRAHDHFHAVACCTRCGAFIATDMIDEHYAELHHPVIDPLIDYQIRHAAEQEETR